MHQDGRGDDPNSSGGESDGGIAPRGNGGAAGSNSHGLDDGGDMDSKRKRRLELNRKVAPSQAVGLFARRRFGLVKRTSAALYVRHLCMAIDFCENQGTPQKKSCLELMALGTRAW